MIWFKRNGFVLIMLIIVFGGCIYGAIKEGL